MGKTHWKSLGDSSQYLGKQHFGPNEEKIVTIEDLEEQIVENAQKRTKEKKRILHFVEPDVRPLILNATNGKRIQNLFDSPYKEDWQGKQIILFVDTSVPNNFDSDNPGGIRVKNHLPKVTTAICADCGKEITAHDKYSVNKIITRSEARFGAKLCWDCSMKRTEAEKEDNDGRE